MAPLEQAFEHELRAFKRRNDTIGYWNFHLRNACTERQYNHQRPEVATRPQKKTLRSHLCRLTVAKESDSTNVESGHEEIL